MTNLQGEFKQMYLDANYPPPPDVWTRWLRSASDEKLRVLFAEAIHSARDARWARLADIAQQTMMERGVADAPSFSTIRLYENRTTGRTRIGNAERPENPYPRFPV